MKNKNMVKRIILSDVRHDVFNLIEKVGGLIDELEKMNKDNKATYDELYQVYRLLEDAWNVPIKDEK